jgi:hypothetical protein
MTNSRKPQSEKLATGGGRGTTAVKPNVTLPMSSTLRPEMTNYDSNY